MNSFMAIKIKRVADGAIFEVSEKAYNVCYRDSKEYTLADKKEAKAAVPDTEAETKKQSK